MDLPFQLLHRVEPNYKDYFPIPAGTVACLPDGPVFFSPCTHPASLGGDLCPGHLEQTRASALSWGLSWLLARTGCGHRVAAGPRERPSLGRGVGRVSLLPWSPWEALWGADKAPLPAPGQPWWTWNRKAGLLGHEGTFHSFGKVTC